MTVQTAEDISQATVSARQAGRLVGVSGQAVLNWINDGRIDAERNGGGAWKVPVTEVLREGIWREMRGKVRERTADTYRGHYEGFVRDVALAAERFLAAWGDYRDADDKGSAPTRSGTPWGNLDQAAVDLRKAIAALDSYRGAYAFTKQFRQALLEVEPDRAEEAEQEEFAVE